MPKYSDFIKSDLCKAFEAAQAQEKPNISKIAREYGVNRATLCDRVNKSKQPQKPRIAANKALKEYQEKALIQWIIFMRDHNMPVTPSHVEVYANQSLQHTGESRQVGKI
ncbi:hypothetical protein IFM51744_09613 [Aspergillus udagawae]|nr:hypothetical protein IFM51744_09613 [Aspergillus udagawae]